MRGFTATLARFMASRRFYWLVIGFFVFEALWIVFSANYPMAFDEDFHLGVIRIYSEQWSPFLNGQPENANQFGALAADPSYLFHYFMSFPYRFIALITDNLAAQVIFLRLINVAFIVSGVVLFGKVVRRGGASALLTNVATLLFVLVPAVVLLAGQINYDNLIILAFAWTCLLVLKIIEDLKTRTLDLRTFALFALALMLSSLIKYAFLPLALVAFLYVTFMVWRSFRGHDFAGAIKKGYGALSTRLKVGLAVLLVVSSGLFAQRYGANMISYGHPVPDCAKVIGVEACVEYGPWGRNYRFAATKGEVDPNPIAFTWVWLQGLHYRMFFMVNGPPLHINYPPSPLPSAAAIIILLSGAVALILYWRKITAGRPFVLLAILMTVVYAGFLWSFTNYSQYLQTGQPVAINGRYFIPLLLPLAVVFGVALSTVLRRWKSARVWVAVAAIILFMQGGGIFGFIMRTDESWYWPNQTVVRVNDTARTVLDPFILQGPKHY